MFFWYFLVCAHITNLTPSSQGNVEKVAHLHKTVILSFISNAYSWVLTFLGKKVNNKKKEDFVKGKGSTNNIKIAH